MTNFSPNTGASLVSKGAERNRLLDFARGILILGVIGVHFGSQVISHATEANASAYMGIILNQLFHFSMPGFLFLSGYVLAKKTRQPPKALEFYWRRFRSLAPPYIFLCACYTIWAALSPAHRGPHTFTDFLFQFFVVGMDWPLYFVPLISHCYLLFPPLHRLASSGACGRAATFLVLAGLHAGVGALANTGRIPYLLILGNFTFWGLYFYGGMLVGLGYAPKDSLHCLKRLGPPLAITAAVSLYIALTSIFHPSEASFLLPEVALAYSRPVMMVYNAACAWLIALVVLEGPKFSFRFVDWLGRNSLMVFLWHMVVLRFLWSYTPIARASLSHPALVFAIIIGAAVITASGNEMWRAAKTLALGRAANQRPPPS